MARAPQDDDEDEIRPIDDSDELPANNRRGRRVIDQIAEEEKNKKQDIVEAREKIQVDMNAILGSTSLKISNLLKIGRGAVIEFDQSIDMPIELTINDKVVAMAQVVVKGDKLAVLITKMMKK